MRRPHAPPQPTAAAPPFDRSAAEQLWSIWLRPAPCRASRLSAWLLASACSVAAAAGRRLARCLRRCSGGHALWPITVRGICPHLCPGIMRRRCSSIQPLACQLNPAPRTMDVAASSSSSHAIGGSGWRRCGLTVPAGSDRLQTHVAPCGRRRWSPGTGRAARRWGAACCRPGLLRACCDVGPQPARWFSTPATRLPSRSGGYLLFSFHTTVVVTSWVA